MHYINSIVIYIASILYCSYSNKVLGCCWFFDSFFLAPVISRIDSIGVGRWEGGRVGGEPKAEQSTHSDSKSSAVPSVRDVNW